MFYRILISVLLVSLSVSAYARNPGDPIWGVYASGIGEVINPSIDPCNITYKVAAMDNKRILKNIAVGTMVPIAEGLTWSEAGVVSRWSGQYFEDQPDGVFKTRPCRAETTLRTPPPIVRRNRPNAGGLGGGKNNPSNIGHDIIGNHKLAFTCTSGCSGVWRHTMTVSSMDKQGNFSGTGYYDGDRGYTWTVKGKAIGNRVKFKMVYTGKNKGYTSTNSGNIRPDGTMDGTGFSSTGQKHTWTSQ